MRRGHQSKAVSGLGWAERQREALQSGDLDELLGVAEQVSRRLGYPGGGEWRRWLRETVGTLGAADRSVLEALWDLGIPIATTNYDGLIEEVTDWPAVTWRDGAKVERVLRGDDPGVLHLHGHWEEPASVVLGIRSYEDVLRDAHSQTVQQALRLGKTLVFIGFGAGLRDPNFGKLLVWSRDLFGGSEYRHYRLCRSGERDEIEKQHPPEERIFARSFGAEPTDLAGFLRTLNASGKARASPSHSTTFVTPLPPKPARCLGREAEVETLVGALLVGEPTSILGSGGIGKSTICLQAMRDPRVIERFGARRFFIRCDGATTADDLVGAISTGLGIEPGPRLTSRVTRALAEASTAIALDNLETPWEADTLPTEGVLAAVAAVDGLALTVSLRGGNRPGGVAWREAIEVPPLRGHDPSDLFLEIAGTKHASDVRLGDLLAALDGVPLAIELMAHAAEAEPDLQEISERWQNERTKMLSRGKGRLADLAASIELSLDSPRMTGGARRLVSLMGLLPDGVALSDLNALLPGAGNAAAATLRQLALAFDEPDRLRMLAPVREYVAEERPPEAQDLQRAIAYYAEMALDFGPKCGAEGGRDAAARLSAEAANIESVLTRGLDRNDPAQPMQAAAAFGEFQRFTGLGTTALLVTARDRAERIGEEMLEANCIKKLGDIALARSDHVAAREHYEKALPLYQRIGDVLGEASCVKSLGNIALTRSDHEAAREHYEKALPLYRRVGDRQGEANCVKSLGNIALERSDHKAAREHYERALPLYQGVGDVLGEANCIKSLGNIALEHSDHEAARKHYETALPLYQRVGGVLGEANCIKSFGDIALARSDLNGARAHYEDALALYKRISRPYSIGRAHAKLARVARDQAEHVRHCQAARETWLSIGRQDLVRQLDKGEEA